MIKVSYCFHKFTLLKPKSVTASAVCFVKVTKTMGMMPEFLNGDENQ
jgi:hypothetical protein